MRDDLKNQINSLVWEAYVASLAAPHQSNLDGFINTYVFYRLKDFAWHNRSLVIPRATNLRKQMESRSVGLDLTEQGHETHSLIDIKDTLSKCIVDSVDQEIVDLLTQGYPRLEIISQLGISEIEYKNRVQVIRRKFRRRYYGTE